MNDEKQPPSNRIPAIDIELLEQRLIEAGIPDRRARCNDADGGDFGRKKSPKENVTIF